MPNDDQNSYYTKIANALMDLHLHLESLRNANNSNNNQIEKDWRTARGLEDSIGSCQMVPQEHITEALALLRKYERSI